MLFLKNSIFLSTNYMTKKLIDEKLENFNDRTKRFNTSDLGIAASLVTADFELVALDKINPRKVQFVFRRATGIEKVVDDYWADKLEVKARSYFDNIKMCKNRIYSE